MEEGYERHIRHDCYGVLVNSFNTMLDMFPDKVQHSICTEKAKYEMKSYNFIYQGKDSNKWCFTI